VYLIRRFEPTDMFSTIKLAADTLPERYNPSLFTYFYETFPEGFLVAEMAKKIVGLLIGVKLNQETAKILMLSISEQHRRQKLGSELLKQFFKELHLENIKYIELEVRTDNKKAIEFYKKHGFEVIDKITEFYQNGENAFTMRKQL
jgi:ribosomal-protein-alanine N-acetyltransferase